MNGSDTPQSLSIEKNMLWNSVGSFVSLLCQWLTTVLVVRLSSGFDAAGILSIAMSIGNVFAPIAQFKIRSYQVSDVHQRTSSSEYVAFRVITIVVGFVVSAVYAVFSSSWAALTAVFLYLLYRCVDVFIDVLHGVDQQHFRMDYCGKSMLARGVLSLGSFCVALALTNSLDFAIAAMVVSVIPVVFYDWHMASQFERLSPHISGSKVRELFTTCLPAAIGSSLCNMVTAIARQSLAAIAGNTILGIYASVCTPIVVIQAGSSYIYAPLQGVFARYIDSCNQGSFYKLLIRVTLAMVGITVVGIVGFALLGAPFLSIVFGPELAQYSHLMYPAIVSVIACAYSSFLCDLLIAFRAMVSTLVCNLVSVAIAATFSYPIISSFGANGTSYVVSIAYLVGVVLMLVVIGRKMGRVGEP